MCPVRHSAATMLALTTFEGLQSGHASLLDRRIAGSAEASKADRLFAALLGGALIPIGDALVFGEVYLVARLVRLIAR
jgi:hypothetical protein